MIGNTQAWVLNLHKLGFPPEMILKLNLNSVIGRYTYYSILANERKLVIVIYILTL